MCEERGQTQTKILSLLFSVVVLECAHSGDLSSHLRSGNETPSQSPPKMDAVIFSCFHIVIVDSVQLLSLNCHVSYPIGPSSSFRSHTHFCNHQNPSLICCKYISIFNPGVHCYSGRDFPICFFPRAFLSLCLFPCLDFLSHMFLSFSPSCSWLLKVAIGVPNYFTYIHIYIYTQIYIDTCITFINFYNYHGVKKTQMIQFAKKKYYTNWYLGKKIL